MVESRVFVGPLRGFDRAGLGLRCPEHERPNPRMHHRADAHETRLDRDVQRRAGEPVVADPLARRAHRHDLGMRGGIVRLARLIVAPADDVAVEDDDAADWYLSQLRGLRGSLQRFVHEGFMHERLTASRRTAP